MKKLKLIFLLAALFGGSQAATTQSAIMDPSADDKGILIPRLNFNNTPNIRQYTLPLESKPSVV